MNSDNSTLRKTDPTITGRTSFLPSHASLGRIDQYELIRKLGGGGFGVVYLARDTISRADVALKTLHPLLKQNPEELENLRRNFGLVARLAHPNIATALVLHPVRDVAVTDEATRGELRLSRGDSVMVMRYAPGVTLSKWRRQFSGEVVPLPIVIEVGRQIASALDYAHGEHIVHRDIKPENVMVETLPAAASQPSQAQGSEFGIRSSGGASSPGDQPAIRVRILDFGLAAEIRSSMSRVSKEPCDTSGTRPYMAPEQWRGKKQNGQTDQYALACALYELISGAPPFAGAFDTGDPIIMANAVTNFQPETIDGIPPAACAALQKALAKQPEDRFASCMDFIDALASESAAIPEKQKKGEDRKIAADRAAPAANARAIQAEPEDEDNPALPERDILRLFRSAIHPVRLARKRTSDQLAALDAASTAKEALGILGMLADGLRDDFVAANQGGVELRRIEPFFHRGAWGNLHSRLAIKTSRTQTESAIWHFFKMERAFCRPDR